MQAIRNFTRMAPLRMSSSRYVGLKNVGSSRQNNLFRRHSVYSSSNQNIPIENENGYVVDDDVILTTDQNFPYIPYDCE